MPNYFSRVVGNEAYITRIDWFDDDFASPTVKVGFNSPASDAAIDVNIFDLPIGANGQSFTEDEKVDALRQTLVMVFELPNPYFRLFYDGRLSD